MVSALGEDISDGVIHPEEKVKVKVRDLVVAGAAWNPPVCCTLERGGFLFMSKDVEWNLRQERSVCGVEADGRAVDVVKVEHGERLKFQPSVGSGRCRGSLDPAGVVYTGTRWFSVHVERCGMEAETGAWRLWC